MNKLEEIIEKQDSYSNHTNVIKIGDAKQVAIEFAKHILKEAAENVKTIREEEYDNRLGEYFYYDYVDKKSITDTINKYL